MGIGRTPPSELQTQLAGSLFWPSFPEIRVGTRTLTNFGLFPRDQSGHSDFDKFWPLSQRSEWALGL